MALRKSIVKQFEIPNEPGHWMQLRMLGWRQLETSKRVKQQEQFDNIRKMGKDVFTAINMSRADMEKSGKAKKEDPLNDHDLMTLLEKGVVAWSYDEPVSAESLGELDEQTAVWAARIIIGASDTDDPKAPSEPSTSPSTAVDAPPTSGF